MLKLRLVIPATLLAVLLVLAILQTTTGRSQRKIFVPEPLINATEAELGQVALDYTYAHFGVTGGAPVVRLTMPRVTQDELDSVGLGRMDFRGEEPPLGLVALQGTFDISSLPGMKVVGYGYHYLVYIFDLRAGIPTRISYSRDGSSFKVLLKDPSLPSPPQPTVIPNEFVAPLEAFATVTKVPYGSTAVPLETQKP